MEKLEGITPTELSRKLEVSTGYISDIKSGRIKAGGKKFWDGIKHHYPKWFPYLRGIANTTPYQAYTSGRGEGFSVDRDPEHAPRQKDSDRGSYGRPDLRGFRPVEVYSRMEDLFKDPDLAARIQAQLLEIERLSPDTLETVRVYLQGILDALKVKKIENDAS